MFKHQEKNYPLFVRVKQNTTDLQCLLLHFPSHTLAYPVIDVSNYIVTLLLFFTMKMIIYNFRPSNRRRFRELDGMH
jgi:hypothetical protein